MLYGQHLSGRSAVRRPSEPVAGLELVQNTPILRPQAEHLIIAVVLPPTDSERRFQRYIYLRCERSRYEQHCTANDDHTAAVN